MSERITEEGIKNTKKAYYDIDANIDNIDNWKVVQTGDPQLHKRWKKIFRALKKNKILLLYKYFFTSSVKSKTEFTAVPLYIDAHN